MNRIAIEIAGLPIYWYGIMFAAGIAIGIWTGSKRAAISGKITPKQFLDATPWIVLGTIIGARALFVFTYWNEYFAGKSLMEIFDLRGGGLVFFGGFILTVILLAIYLAKNRISAFAFLDVTAPSLAIGHAIGRIGCFINGCCYGAVTNCPLGVHYPEWHETHGVAVHPVQLYESALNLLLYGTLEYLFRKKHRFDGQITALYFMGYGVIRMITECFRGDVPNVLWNLSQAQCIAISVFLIGLGMFLWKMPKSKGN